MKEKLRVYQNNRREEGLTLVEILVAIALLAVVSVMVVSLINTTMNSATRFGNVSSTQTEVSNASSTIQRDLSAAQKVIKASNNSVTVLLRQSNQDYEVTYFAYDPQNGLAVPTGVITAQLPNYKAVIELRKNVSNNQYGQRILVKGIDVEGFADSNKHRMFTYFNQDNDEIPVPDFTSNTSTVSLAELTRIERVEFRIAANAAGRGTPIQIESSASVSGTGVTSGTSPETVASIPECPTNFTVDFDDVNSPRDAHLEWYAPSGATSYTIYRTNVNSGQLETSHVIPNPNTTEFTDSDLAWGTTYSWTIQANGAGGSSPQCGPVVGTVIPNTIQFVNKNSLASLAATKSGTGAENLTRAAETNIPAKTVATTNISSGNRYTVARGTTNQLAWASTYGAVGYRVYETTDLVTPVATITNANTRFVQLPADYGNVKNYVIKAYNAGGESHTSNVTELISPPVATPFTVSDPDTSTRSVTDTRINMSTVAPNTHGFRASKNEGFYTSAAESCINNIPAKTNLNFTNKPAATTNWDTDADWGTSGCYRLTPFNDAGPGVASSDSVNHKPGKFAFGNITNPTVYHYIDEGRNRHGTVGAGMSLPWCWSNPTNGTTIGNCAGNVTVHSHTPQAYGPMGMFGRRDNSFTSINIVWSNSAGAYGDYTVTRKRLETSNNPDQNGNNANTTTTAEFVNANQSLLYNYEMPGSVYEFTVRAKSLNGTYRDRKTQHVSRPDIPHHYSGTYWTRDFGSYYGDRIKAKVHISAIRGLATSVSFGSQMPGPNPGVKVETKNINNAYETFYSNYQTVERAQNRRWVVTNLTKNITIQPAGISSGADVQRNTTVTVKSQEVGRSGQINIINCSNCYAQEKQWLEEGYPYWATGTPARYWSGGAAKAGTVSPGNVSAVDAPPLPEDVTVENTCARYVETDPNFTDDPYCEPGDGIPPAPTLSATRTGTTTHNITWSTWQALTGYEVTYSINGATPIVLSKSHTDRTLSLNIPVGQSATVSVTAKNKHFDSEPGTITVTSTPGVPTGLNASVTNNNLSATWTAVSGATSYVVSYTTGGVTKTATATGTSITLSNLPAGSYQVRVQAIAGPTSSGWSAIVTRAVLVAPTGVTATVSGTTITVSWQPVAGATSYQVVRNGVTTAATSSPLVLTGMAAGAHNIQVRALATSSTGPLSATTTANIVLNTPTGFKATVNGQTMNLSWNATPAAVSYNVRYKVGSGAYTTRSVTGTATSLTGLPYNVYTVEVAAVSGSITSPYTTLTRAVLAAPTGVTATISGTTITVSWQPVAGATSYQVLRNGVATTATASPLVLTNMAAGAHNIQVRALATSSTGTLSATKTVTIALNPPTGFKATVNGQTMNLSWNAELAAESYNVRYKVGSGAYTTRSVTGTSTSLTGLPYNVYTVEVAAVSGSITTAYTTLTRAVLAAPTGVTATVSGATITVSWQPVAGATSYQVIRNGVTTAATSSPLVLTNMAAGAHNIQVRALATSSTGALSATTTANVVLKAPTGFNATVNGQTMSLSWNAVPAAVSYNVRYKVGSGAYTTRSVTGTSTSLTGLPYNVYTVEVAAASGSITSPYTTLTRAVLAAPTGVTATVSGTTITVSWQPVAGATSYQVIRNGVTTAATSSPLVLTNMAAGAHNIQVRALATSSTGTLSATTTANIPLNTPTGFKATVSGQTMNLSWNAVPAAVSYNVRYKVGSGAYTTRSVTGTSTSLTGLPYNVYTVEVAAVSGSITTAYTTLTRAVLAAPTGVTATVSGTTITVSWQPVAGATSYQVIRNGVTTAATSSPLVLTGMAIGAHNIQVRALATSSTGALSATKTANVVLTTPTGFKATVSGQTMSLSWNAVPGAASYSVRYKVGSGAYTTRSVTGTSTSLTGLPYNVYTVEVAAVSGSVTSPYATLSRAVLAAPTGVTATVSGATITVSWQPVTGATSYQVVRNGVTTAATSSPLVLTNMAVGAHNIQVRALATSSTGALSATKTANVVLTTPTGFNATVSGQTMSLSWNAVPAAASYSVRYKVGSGAYTTRSVTGTSTSLTGLPYNVYTVEVAAVRGTVTTTYATLSRAVLAAPTGVTATVSGTTITVSWQPVSGATSYQVVRNGVTTAATSSPLVLTNMAVGAHNIQVRALATSSTGALSATKTANVVLTTPTGFNATVSGQTMSLSWNAVPGAASYSVRYKVGSGAYTTRSVTGTSASLTGLPYNVYTVEVAAVSGSVTTAYATLSRTVLATPATPTSATVTALVNQIRVQWTPVANATSYQIQYKIGTGAAVIINAGTSGSTNITTTARGSATFQIRAIAGTTTTAWSGTLTRTLLSDPSTFTVAGEYLLVPSSGGNTRHDVTWSAVANATQYRISWSGSTSGSVHATGTSASVHANLSPGLVTWTIEAQAADGGYSNGKTFTQRVLPRPVASAIEILNNGSNLRASWAAITGATFHWSLVGQSGSTTGTSVTVSNSKTGTHWLNLYATAPGFTSKPVAQNRMVTLKPEFTSTDLLAMDNAKVLWNYGSNPDASTSTRVQISGTYSSAYRYNVADLDADGIMDLIVQQNNGMLMGYFGYPNGGFRTVQLGYSAEGWHNFEVAVGYRKSTDAYPSVFLKDAAGNLYARLFTSNYTLAQPSLVTSGWGSYSIQALDYDKNGAVDWIVRNSSGALIRHRTDTAGNIMTGVTIATTNWSSYGYGSSNDYNAVGNRGLMTRIGNAMYYYPVTSTGQLGTRVKLAGMWAVNLLLPGQH